MIDDGEFAFVCFIQADKECFSDVALKCNRSYCVAIVRIVKTHDPAIAILSLLQRGEGNVAVAFASDELIFEGEELSGRRKMRGWQDVELAALLFS